MPNIVCVCVCWFDNEATAKKNEAVWNTELETKGRGVLRVRANHKIIRSRCQIGLDIRLENQCVCIYINTLNCVKCLKINKLSWTSDLDES